MKHGYRQAVIINEEDRVPTYRALWIKLDSSNVAKINLLRHLLFPAQSGWMKEGDKYAIE